MNDSYIIVTDSGSDLPASLIKDLNVYSVPLTVLVEGEDALPDDQVDRKTFYSNLRSGKKASTAAVNLEQFLEIFRSLLQEGKDLLYIGFSSGLSSTFQMGKAAADELREEFPDRKIFAVDTLAASLGEGLLVYHAAQLREKGKSIEEVRDWLEENKLHLCHWFTVDDLMFLKRGGRVSAATAVVGGMLQIKPVMHVDNAGHLIKVTTARGRKASIQALFAKIGETAYEPEKQVYFISHGDCGEEAEALAEQIRKTYGAETVVTGYVGAVIGAHSGPGTMALFFLGSER